jgi:hypothetical protein
MRQHTTKDSGERDEFPTGARRDTEKGKLKLQDIPFKALVELARKAGDDDDYMFIDRHEKPIHEATGEQRHDLIPSVAMERLAALYARGEAKYGANNWQKGINLRRTFGSLLRHAFAWFLGDTSEDHLAAVIWNAIALLWVEREIDNYRIPRDMDDRQKACTRVVYCWKKDRVKKTMDLEGWLTDDIAFERCQAYWTTPIEVFKIIHFVE